MFWVPNSVVDIIYGYNIATRENNQNSEDSGRRIKGGSE